MTSKDKAWKWEQYDLKKKKAILQAWGKEDKKLWLQWLLFSSYPSFKTSERKQFLFYQTRKWAERSVKYDKEFWIWARSWDPWLRAERPCMPTVSQLSSITSLRFNHSVPVVQLLPNPCCKMKLHLTGVLWNLWKNTDSPKKTWPLSRLLIHRKCIYTDNKNNL